MSNMADVDLARSLLQQDSCNLVIVKNGQILFSSRERGIKPFYQAVQSLGDRLHHASLADRIVGSAIAMLCLDVQIDSVYAVIASQAALDMLTKKGVTVNAENTVPSISNYDGTDLCPFEKLAMSCRNPSELRKALESLLEEGRQ